MKRMWGCVFVVCVFAYFSWAQNLSGEVAADKEDVQKFFVTLHLREMMQNMMMTSMQQQTQLTRDTLKEKVPRITNEELNRIDAVVDDLVKTIDVNRILDDMIPVYQRHLSKQDVDAMLAFYNTPTGQKLLREQPAMMAEGMQAMQPRMKKMMSDVMDKVEQIARQQSGKTDAPVK